MDIISNNRREVKYFFINFSFFFANTGFFTERTPRDKIKTDYCNKKGIKLSDDKLKELSSDVTKAKMFIEMASSMEDKKAIDPKFVKNVVIGQESTVLSAVDKSKARRLKAQELIDSKQAKDMVEAIAMLPDADYK